MHADDYYEVVAPWLDRSLRDRGDVGWWRDRVERCGAGPILELGCGTGRVTAALAGARCRGTRSMDERVPERGARQLSSTGTIAIGIDRSDAMLAMARRRLAGHPDVHLIRGDFRELPFADAAFACVVAPDDPFIHLTTDADRQRAIDEAARVLAPGGRLWLEFLWWTPRDESHARSAAGLDIGPGETAGDAPGIGIHEHWRESGTGSVRATYRYRVDGDVVLEASFVGRRWTREELDRRLSSARLRLARCWGGFDGRAFDVETASALLVEARLAA